MNSSFSIRLAMNTFLAKRSNFQLLHILLLSRDLFGLYLVWISKQIFLVSIHTHTHVLNGWTRTAATSTFCVFLAYFFLRVFPFWLCHSLNGLQWPQPVYELQAQGWRMEDTSGLCTASTPSVPLPSCLSLSEERRGVDWVKKKKGGVGHSPTNSSVDDVLKYRFKVLYVNIFALNSVTFFSHLTLASLKLGLHQRYILECTRSGIISYHTL